MKQWYITINQAIESGLVYVFEVHSEDIEKDISRIIDGGLENPHFRKLVGAACPVLFNAKSLQIEYFEKKAKMKAYLDALSINFFYRFCGRVICCDRHMWFLRGGDLKDQSMAFFHVGDSSIDEEDERSLQKIISTNIGYLINFCNRILCPLHGPVSDDILSNLNEEDPGISRDCCVLFQDVGLDDMMDFCRKIYTSQFDHVYFFYFSKERKNLFKITFEDDQINIKYCLRIGVKI